MVTCFLCGFLLGQGVGPFLHFWGTQQRRTPEASRKQLISPVASRQIDNSVDISVALLIQVQLLGSTGSRDLAPVTLPPPSGHSCVTLRTFPSWLVWRGWL